MILITLGTQQQSFARLLDCVEKCNIKEEIIVQAGHTKYKTKKMKILEFISYEEIDDLRNRANLIITHGGTASIIDAIKKGKKVIACPRLKKYGEHVDDHQQEIIDIFSDEGYILKLDEEDNLDDLMKRIKKFKPKKYKSNTDKFIEKLVKQI